MISLYHICPSKVRAYNSKGELKILLFYVVDDDHVLCPKYYESWLTLLDAG